MLVVLVMEVVVIVRCRSVLVVVAVPFSEVQQDSNPHEDGPGEKKDRHLISED